jgi:tetratricopeptide (TPR) repeat protein
LADALERALSLHRQGKLPEAARLYQKALLAEPTRFDALHALGILRSQEGRHGEAVDLFRRALRQRPESAEAQYNLGIAFEALGQFREAAAHYNATLALRPDIFAAHNNLGNVLQALGRHEDAVAHYRRALALKPDLALAHNNLGNALYALKRHEEALDHYRRAIALQPDYIDAHNNLGNLLGRLGRPDDAVACYQRALALEPRYVNAQYNLGNALKELNRMDEAMAAYDQAIAHYREVVRLEPNNALAHVELGRLLVSEERTEEALPFFHETVRLESRRAGAQSDMALALDARNYIGIGLVVLRRWDEALAYLQETLTLAPQSPEAHYNLGYVLLLLGRLDEGFAHYQWRWQRDQLKTCARPFRQPEWQGEDVAGGTLLIHDEQGLGDTLQFCRYVPLAARRCRSLYVEVQPELVRLLRLSLEAPGLQIVPRVPQFPAVDGLPETDYQCPLMSLPRAFGTTLASIPAEIPYLHAEPAEVAAWSQRLSPLPRPRVGLVWAGRRINTQDHVRSIAPHRLAPLAAVAGVSFVSLQKRDARDADTPAMLSPPGITLHDFTAELRDLADTAALVTALDLVIAVDTAMAHLAGALGKPVWLMNRSHSDWRWLIDREDSPWYPTLRIFRQPRRGDWESVIERVAGELQTLVAERFC